MGSKNSGSDVAVKQNTGVLLQSDMPDYIKKDSRRGTEGVTSDDVVIPRLEVVQALSPCLKKQDPAYIEGSEQGMLYNSVTRELYGIKAIVVPVMFKKEWILWKARKSGGGFLGVAPTFDEAEAMKAAIPAEQAKADEIENTDTAQQFCYLLKENGTFEEIVVSMSKSKMKVSRKWNSLIRIAGGDSFARAYAVTSVSEVNKRNESYFNFSVAVAGFPPKPVYEAAEKLYERVKAGQVSADRSDATGGEPEGSGTEV